MNFHRSEPTEIPLALTAGRVGQAHLRHGSTGEGPTTWDIRHLAKGVIERTYACGSVTGNTDPLDRRRSTARRNDASLQERHRRQFTSLTEVTEAEVGNVVTVPREDERSLKSPGSGYLHDLHRVLVIALVLICAGTGVVGWWLHPASEGFQEVPQGLRVVTSGSQFVLKETLVPTGDGGATLYVDEPTSTGDGVPLLAAGYIEPQTVPGQAGR